MAKYDEYLVERAKQASRNAYAPYSNFKVGAAIRSVAGKIFSGCIVENAAYPQGTCAEAGAIAAMILEGEVLIDELVVFVEVDKFITPCGGCRQRIREFSDEFTEVIMCSPDGIKDRINLSKLLPQSFGPEHL